MFLRVCHDFGAPLRAINIHAEMLRRLGITGGETAAEAAQHLDAILHGAADAELLKRGLVSYAIALQVEPGTFRPAPLGALVRSVLAKLRKEITSSSADIQVGELPTVFGDQDRLMDVFEHILRNALVHRGTEAPHIRIASEERDGGWLLSVRDNGAGVEERYLESIFRPFERVRRGERSGPGLGLAICRAIIERHGGKVWAESPSGGGLDIRWTLPAGE